MWKDYDLPSSVVIDGVEFEINADWRNIIDIFECLNDEELTQYEKIDCSLYKFYKDYENITNGHKAFEQLGIFINGNRKEPQGNAQSLHKAHNDIKLVDWEKDLTIIIPPVNKALGYDVREKPFLHWWTFLGGFYEIGECTFKTYVGIRYKLAKRKKLEDWEKECYREHKYEIDIAQTTIAYDNFDDEDILMKLARQKNTIFAEEEGGF